MAQTEMIDGRAALATLGLGEAGEVWLADWSRSQASYTPGAVFFLQAAWIDDACRRLNMAADSTDAVRRAAKALAVNPALERLAWHVHFMVFRSGLDQVAAAWRWPMLPDSFGEASRMFYGVICISGLDALEERHAKLAIPASITRDTLMDVEIWMNDAKQKTGQWGCKMLGSWLILHCQSRLFRLGRLQFEMTTYPEDWLVLRHRESGAVKVLAPDGTRFNDEGQFVANDAPGWAATLTRGAGVVRGHAVSPRGSVERSPVELLESEWSVALAKGDAVLGVHIPASGPMSHEACGESFRAAMAFFSRHFPAHQFRAFTSCSWLFDAQLEDHLPAESNIVRFLREFYLLPVRGSGDWQTFERVFGEKTVDLDKVPQDTSLRRAVVKFAKAGGKWRNAAMVLLRDDLDWGKQVYRK